MEWCRGRSFLICTYRYFLFKKPPFFRSYEDFLSEKGGFSYDLCLWEIFKILDTQICEIVGLIIDKFSMGKISAFEKKILIKICMIILPFRNLEQRKFP